MAWGDPKDVSTWKTTAMQINVVTSRAELFQEIHHTCRHLFSQCCIQQWDPAEWAGDDRPDASPPVPAWILLDPLCGSTIASGLFDDSATDAWIAVRGSGLQQSAVHDHWKLLSRMEFLRQARNLADCCDGHSLLREEVLLVSDHLRLTQYCLSTRCALIPQIRDRLLRSIDDFTLASESVQNQFCMALDEALANAFYHGNLELCSLLKEDGSSRFHTLAAERELLPPWSGRRVVISELVTRIGLWVTIQDEGRGFDVNAAIARANNPENLLASGRGLLMMQAFADELFFNRAGNQVTLVLYTRNPGTSGWGSACRLAADSSGCAENAG